MGRDAYHHGDLRRALLEAAELVLAERGVSGFTLRECARRAGVSHAAPAHHFGDARGLLTALAALGFATLTAFMREAREGMEDPRDRLRAIARGYVAFARRHPERFRLTFSRSRLDGDDPAYHAAAEEAFDELATAIRLVHGRPDAPLDEALRASLTRAWSVVHGFSHLLLEGHFAHLTGGDEAAVDRHLEDVVGAMAA